MAGSEGKRHPRDEGLGGVLRVGGGVRGMCRVRGDWGMGCVRAEGQRRRVDAVVIHHRAGQHQLQQTEETKSEDTNKTNTEGGKNG